MICLSCAESSIEADLELIENNRAYIGIAEIRADYLDSEMLNYLSVFPGLTDIPCILTFRTPEEGGGNSGAAAKRRIEILMAALEGRWAYLDIGDDADSLSGLQLIKTAESTGARIIRSLYGFKGVPEDLGDQMIEVSKGDRYMPKAVVNPADTADLFKVIDAHRRFREVREKSDGYSCINGPVISDYILSATGSFGVPAVIMAAAWGSMLTFCRAGGKKAADSISPSELVKIYNYNKLKKNTEVFGIIGNPVMHTKSPALHNKAIKENKLNAVYLPFETDDPELLMQRADELNLKGLSVTIPHKQTVISLADSLDDSVHSIGACNTLVKEQKWKGYNTDWIGFLKPLEGEILEGRDAIVIGAGGAARAVVYALVSVGMKVTIINRTASKAEELGADFNCRGGGFELLDGPAMLLVQTTSVGMEPDIEGNPLPDFDFSGVEIVYDIIYTPEKTALLAAAEKSGCRIINGYPMLKAQAVEQFRLFTGKTMV